MILRERLSDGLDPERNGEAAIARALAPASSTFVDVGANVGDWSALFCGLAPETARGLLVGPAEVTVRQLEQRFADRASVTVVQGAASDRVGRAQFFEGTGASEASSLLESSPPRGRDRAVGRVDHGRRALGPIRDRRARFPQDRRRGV